MTRTLHVYLYGERIGLLSEDEQGHLHFTYRGAPYPLSVRMPICESEYGSSYAEPFFGNLTPEGNVLSSLEQKYRISGDNTFSVLKLIGGECAGAVALYPEELAQPVNEARQELRAQDIAAIIEALPTNPLLTGLKSAPRLSLAGAQSKFAVCKTADGRYYRSDDANPTTHIIKVSNKNYEGLLENEYFCMSLARAFFADSVEVNMREAEGWKYMEIQRYDRRVSGGRVERIHQEDMCQVLGCLSIKKYQSDGGPSIRKMYEAIQRYSSRRLADGFKFLQMLIFNYLIGNTDTHAKNFSFIHTNRSNSVVLSPAYDLVSIDIYPEKLVSHEMALVVNGKARYGALRRKDWLALFEQLGMNPISLMKEMEKSFARIAEKAEQLAERLNADALTASDIYLRIIENIRVRREVIFGGGA